MMRKLLFAMTLCLGAITAQAESVPFGKGRLTVTPVARNAVRVQYAEGEVKDDLPDWLYVRHDQVKKCDVKINIDSDRQQLTLSDRQGHVLFTATSHQLRPSASEPGLYEASMAFLTPSDEHLYGLGQFQDGYSDVRGLTRRLTQVNTQIALPMLLSTACCGITTD